MLGQAAPALPPRPAPPAVQAWLAPLGPTVASVEWPLVSDVFRPAHPQDAGEAATVWRAFRAFAKAAGYEARPAAERDFTSFVRSVGDSAAWLRCMLRCNPGRVLLVPHPAAELPFVAGEEEYAYLEDWRTRLRHRPAVPFGHSLALANFGGVGPLIALASAGPATAPADLALEAARRARGELVSARRAGHGAIFLPVRSGLALTPARAPLPPAMVTRCATPRLLTYEYPPVVHQQQSLLQAFPCHPIQGTAYVMLTAAIVSGLLRAYRETRRVFEPSPCYYDLTRKFKVDDLAPGDRAAADALEEYDAIARAVPWAAVHDLLPYHHDPTRQAPSTLLPHQVGTVADGRCHYVRVVSVERSPQAPLGVMLAEPRLADAAPRALPVTTEPWAIPAGFASSDPAAVPPSAEEAAASAAYRARKRRHADMARGGPAQPEPHPPGPRDLAEEEEGASVGDPGGPDSYPRGSATSTLAGSGEWGERAADREDGAGAAHDERWDATWRGDHAGAAGDGPGRGWASESGGGAAAPRRDREDRWEGGPGRHADVPDDRVWSAPGPSDGRGYMASGRDGPAWSSDGGQGHDGGAGGGRYGRSEYRPTGDAAAPAGPRSVHWDVGPDNDGPAMAPMELGVAGPVVTPVPGQPDVAYDWWLSTSWTPPTPVTATEWRDSLTSGQVGALFGYDPSVNWSEVGPREITAAMVEYARIGLAGVVPPCLESPRTRAKRFHAALRRVLRKTGRPVHVWEYRRHD